MTTATAPLPAVRRQGAAADVALIWGRVILIGVILGAAWLGIAPLTVTPTVLPAADTTHMFSAERALQELAWVAAQPHPIGSPANQAVRDGLLARVRSLGLEPQVQDATLAELSPLSGAAQVVRVENVLVRVPGTAGAGDAVLVTGHYDSVPTSPGAADCGACVVTVLETLRAVLAGPKLQHDVIFLFTDGEERGILGARAFMQQHPWAKDVRMSLVFEGLGNRGSSFLYAAGANSGRMLDEALAGMSSSVGYRFVDDILWNLAGNSGSDLDEFVAGGRAGVAFVHLALEGSQAYHTAADRIDLLDPGTLQQHGDHALSLVRHFGDASLAEWADGAANPVYFSLAPGLVVHYPVAWALPLALAAVAVYVGTLSLGLRRRALSLGGLIAAALAVALTLAVGLVLASALWWGLRVVNPNLHQPSVSGWYGATWTALGLLSLSLAVAAGFQFLWRRWLGLPALAAGALLWWAVLAVLTATSLPGFGAFFVWPLLAASLYLGWCWWRPVAAQRPWPQTAALSLAAAVAVVMAAPVVYILAVYAGRMEAMLALPLAALPLPFALLTIALLAPQVEFLAPARRWWLPGGALVAAGLCLALGWFSTGFDAAHPRLNTAIYWLDAEPGSAHWLTIDDARNGRGAGAQLDGWTSQFFPDGGKPAEFNPWLIGSFAGSYTATAAKAQPLSFARPEVTLLEDTVEGDQRVLRLRVTPTAAALDSHIHLSSEQPLRLVTLNDRPLAGAPAATNVPVNVYGRPTGPVELTLVAAQGVPVKVRVLDRLLGLPENAGVQITPRPDWMAPSPYNDTADSTVIEQVANF